MSQQETSFDGGHNELSHSLAVIRMRKWSIVLVAAVVLASTAYFSLRQTPLYESSARVLVEPISISSGFGTDASALPPNLETEKEVATSAPVLEAAAEELNLAEPGALLDGFSVDLATSTEILVMSYSSPEPETARRRVQALADSYLNNRRRQVLKDLLASSDTVQDQLKSLNGQLQGINNDISGESNASQKAILQTQASTLVGQIAVLQQQLTGLTPPDKLQVGRVLAPASLPTAPSSPNHVQNAVLALAAGLVAGVGVAFARERLDDRLRGRSDLESHLRTPVLAVVPRVKGWRRRKRALNVTLTKPDSVAAEAYRTLRTGIVFAASAREAKSVLITSPHPGDGKTVTAANLAVALAHAGKKVVVVSADLRKPRLHRFFGARNEAGLSNVLTGTTPLQEVLAPTDIDNLRLLPSGPAPKHPGELLGSEAMRTALDELTKDFDMVLVDAPPLLAVADAMTLAPVVDAVLFVAEAENTSRAAVDLAISQLDQVRAHVIGAVLNNFDPSKARAYSTGYEGYYASSYGRHARIKGRDKGRDKIEELVN
ncbi:MAG: polysaccharide biosynthesis tyrosine autokinase [Actinomycetota bacterium]|nr:polysaccharide biosynthesis tyrosine autokinase [Actinomycetota bacterium]